MNENTDCVVTVTDLADQHAFTEALASADILTNGTKVGMKPLENESLIGDVSLLRPELLVTECVYNPHMTKLCSRRNKLVAKQLMVTACCYGKEPNSLNCGQEKHFHWTM